VLVDRKNDSCWCIPSFLGYDAKDFRNVIMTFARDLSLTADITNRPRGLDIENAVEIREKEQSTTVVISDKTCDWVIYIEANGICQSILDALSKVSP
jgi:hypothetical protein